MEGFSDSKVAKILKMPSRYSPTAIIWCGHKSVENHITLRYNPRKILSIQYRRYNLSG